MKRYCILAIAGSTTATLAAACSSSRTDEGASEVSIDKPREDPNTLIPGASGLLADNIALSDVGETFGVDDDHVPYPDSFWPFDEARKHEVNGIDWRWNHGEHSPLEKFMQLTDPDHTDAAKRWEHRYHGAGLPGVSDWWGHCPGWTGASMSNAPIQHAVYAKSDGDGGIVSCDAGEWSCIRFDIGDINALMAEVYVDGPANFIGGRCDLAPAAVPRDADGRILPDPMQNHFCEGLNPGSLVIVLGQWMKKEHRVLAIDAQSPSHTEEIWNQPAFRYTVHAYAALDEGSAANLVLRGSRAGDLRHYRWNGNAHGWVSVDITIHWVHERGPNKRVIPGTESTRTTRFTAVIELDKPASDPSAQIIGGEYTQDDAAGTNRLTVPPFVWISTGMGPEDPRAEDGFADNPNDFHNPYIKPSIVKQLIELGQE